MRVHMTSLGCANMAHVTQGPALTILGYIGMDEHTRLRPVLRGKSVNSAALETTDLCLDLQTVLPWQWTS